MEKNVTILSHRSAYNFWMHCDPSLEGFPVPAQESPLPTACAPDWSLANALEATHPAVKTPLHVIVSDRNKFRHAESIKCHTCTAPLPKQAFFEIDNRTYVSAPWLALTQIACQATRAQIAAVTTNLCGDYFVDPLTNELKKRTCRIESPNRIRSMLSKNNILGSKKARDALKWSCAGSLSPMETKTFILLCMPLRDGGYGLPVPVLNERIEGGALGHLLNQSYYLGDLCWKDKKTIVEYDGEQFHQDIARDKRRTNDLNTLGWTIFFLTRETIRDFTLFDSFASQVARCLGCRIRKNAEWYSLHMDLRKSIGC